MYTTDPLCSGGRACLYIFKNVGIELALSWISLCLLFPPCSYLKIIFFFFYSFFFLKPRAKHHLKCWLAVPPQASSQALCLWDCWEPLHQHFFQNGQVSPKCLTQKLQQRGCSCTLFVSRVTQFPAFNFLL